MPSSFDLILDTLAVDLQRRGDRADTFALDSAQDGDGVWVRTAVVEHFLISSGTTEFGSWVNIPPPA